MYLLDMRAAIEAQLRHLTTIQQSIGDFLAPSEARTAEKAKILRELQDISDLNRIVNQTIPHAIRQAETEL